MKFFLFSFFLYKFVLFFADEKLVGARSDKEWFLKEIEITNLNTSVTWLCEFNCWLPKTDEHYQHEVKPAGSRHKDISFDNLTGSLCSSSFEEKFLFF